MSTGGRRGRMSTGGRRGDMFEIFSEVEQIWYNCSSTVVLKNRRQILHHVFIKGANF